MNEPATTASGAPRPSTVVLIHGLWMTPLSWQQWAAWLREHHNFDVLTPTWPRMDHPIEQLRANPSLVGGLGIAEILEHHRTIVAALPQPPIIMGHSLGGLMTQLLLDRGYGAAGVAIHPGQTKGVWHLSPTQARAVWPAIRNPFNVKKGVALTPKQFHRGFANALSTADARTAWDKYHVPATATAIFQGGLANLYDAPTKVDYGNSDRAPLLFLSGSLDRTVPPGLVKANFRRYRDGVVDHHAYPGRSHFTVGEPGWQNVLQRSLDWVLAQL